MKFTLSIELGNDAMRDGVDIASALDRVARDLERFGATTGDHGRIRDENGNTVGKWLVDFDDAELSSVVAHPRA